MKTIHLLLILLLLAGGCNTTKPASEDISNWQLYGRGSAAMNQSGELILAEDQDSLGVMLIGPEVLARDTTIRFQVKPANADTVLVVIHSLSGPEGEDLLPPPDYDGSIQWLLKATHNYFFAFHNSAHRRYPFIRKHIPPKEAVLLIELDSNLVEPEKWISVEVARRGQRLRLAIEGKIILDTIDRSPLGAGRPALRIRGTQKEAARCAIRDLSIK